MCFDYDTKIEILIGSTMQKSVKGLLI